MSGDVAGAASPASVVRERRGNDRPVVSVVVVSYNTRDWTLRCLASLSAASRHELDVVVVDNGSMDGSADAIAAAFPGVRLVRNATKDRKSVV